MTSAPDLLRLLAVPAFAWIALRDYRTRRVPGRAWYPLVALGLVALVWEAAIVLGRSGVAVRIFSVQVAVSLGLLVPLGYALYRLGGFGGADAKAFMTLAVVFPTFPVYRVAGLILPTVRPPVSVFAFAVVTDAVVIGALYPVALLARNALAGRLSPVAFVGWPVEWRALPTAQGKLLETPEGFTRRGLDLDALRMYLRWRGLALADLRERPDVFRSPATLPDEFGDPTDGVVDPALDPESGGTPAAAFDGSDAPDDPWGAEAFLSSIEGSAYGTTPERLRAGLDLIASRDRVWVSPGIPFLVPLFLGLLLALTYGDVLYAVLEATGVA